MNIQIFLDNQELELSPDTAIGLNKTYSNLYNPTDIIVEFSKSINIPITQRNNKVFGNAYRLDRNVVEGSNNIGYCFDPLKKIPMKLIYNGELIMDGYAKFISATSAGDKKHYTISLYGVLGEIFQKLLRVVASPSQLQEDQNNNYVLYDPFTQLKVNKEYIKSSWDNDHNSIGTENIKTTDIIGFAPAHRGLYQEFSPSKIQVDDDTIDDISNYLTTKWKDYFVSIGISEEVAEKRAADMNADEVVGEGFPDYQMREYRSYELKPYIYINQLFELFRNNCRWLTGYEIEYDNTWFNVNNPYWARMCYMLDFLENKGTNPDYEKEFAAQTAVHPSTVTDNTSGYEVKFHTESFVGASKIDTTNGLSIYPFELVLDKKVDFGSTTPPFVTLGLANDTNVFIDVTLTSGGVSHTNKYWSNGYFDESSIPEGYTADTYIPMDKNGLLFMDSIPQDRQYNPQLSWIIPSQNLSTKIVNGVTVSVDVRISNNKTGYDKSKGVWSYYTFDASAPYPQPAWKEYLLSSSTTSTDETMTVAKINYKSTWRVSSTVRLRDIYFGEEPPFKILLQYTKMFGILWDVDYHNKKIILKTKQTYFKDYSIEDWGHKLDRSGDFTVHPLSFEDKFVKFNYDKIDGFRYSGYSDKYGVQYGEKILKTAYDFNTSTHNIFEGVNPSSSSSKNYVPFESFINWRGGGFLSITDDKVLIDAESDDENSPITIENWYLRGKNKVLPYTNIITDDTGKMMGDDCYCYLDREYAINSGMGIETNVFPSFDIAIKGSEVLLNDSGVYGVTFSVPKEDFTSSKLPTQAKGNYIYDLFWNNYISGVYGGRNKKVVGYFNLDHNDYHNFTFNKFVTIDNQLFLVNRIIDFNINGRGTTKCELVQVSDIGTYTNVTKSFPTLSYSPNMVVVDGSKYSNDYGSFNIVVKSTPIINASTVTPSTTSQNTNGIVTSTLSIDNYGEGLVSISLYFQGLGANKEVWNGSLLVWNTSGEISETIPVTIDFSNWTGTSTEPTKYTVTVTEALQCTLDYPSTVNEGETFVCTITPKDPIGGIVVNDCVVKMGGVTLNNSDVINTSTKTITIPNVSGNIELTVSCYSVGDGSGGGNHNGPSLDDVIPIIPR
jgi:hypothetical protein